MISPYLLAVFVTAATRQAPPRAAAPIPDVSVARLPVRLAHDARTLFTTKTPALIIAAAGVASAAAHPADHRTVTSLSGSRGLEDFLDGGAGPGDGTVQGVSALAVYGIGLAVHSPRTQAVGSALVEAQLVNLVMTQSVKSAVNRRRPDGGGESFPSGHASATFATADVLFQEFGWRAGVPAYAGAAYVAISRLTERQHFLSDIVFGAGIGLAAARTLTIQRAGRVIAVSPAPLRGGGAILVHVHAAPPPGR